MKRIAGLFAALALLSVGLSLRAQAPAPTQIQFAGGVLVGAEYDQVYVNTHISPVYGVVSLTTLTAHKWGFADRASVAGNIAVASAPEYYSPGRRVTVTVDTKARTASVVETEETTGAVVYSTGAQDLVDGGLIDVQ